MQEKIIFAPGCNETELLRSLAWHDVKDLFNVRIVNANGLAQLALMRAGITIEKELINFRGEVSIIKEFARTIKFFENISVEDEQAIVLTLRKIRKMVPGINDEKTEIKEALAKGPFQNKNVALLSVYKEYCKRLGENKIDSIKLIREVINKGINLENTSLTILKEYPLMPLEKKMLDVLASKIGYEESSVFKLYGEPEPTDGIKECLEKGEKPDVKIANFTNCFGSANEVDMILSDIYSGKKLDKCTVAVADVNTYSQLFYDNAVLYDLPITFGQGVSITNSYPAEFVKLYFAWADGEYFNPFALKTLLNSSAFNMYELKKNLPSVEVKPEWEHFDRNFWESICSLRLTNNVSINKKRYEEYQKTVYAEFEQIKSLSTTNKDYEAAEAKVAALPRVKYVQEQLCLPMAEFVSKYALIRKDCELVARLDNASLNKICAELNFAEQESLKTADIIQNIMCLRVMRDSAEAGKLHISSIDDALTSIRENLYVAGLSANNFPGTPKENPLLLDGDLVISEKDQNGNVIKAVNIFCNGINETSTEKNKTRYAKFIRFIKLATALKSQIFVSFAGLNVSELKDQNESSVLFDLYKATNAKEKVDGSEKETFKLFKEMIKNNSAQYFEPKLSKSREIGQEYVDGKKIMLPEVKTAEDAALSVEWDGIAFSPSALDDFFSCQRMFFLKRVLRIPEPEEDKPYEILSAIDKGNITHALMERLAVNNDMSYDGFLSLAKESFKNCLIKKPAFDNGINASVGTSAIDDVEDEFLALIANAYVQNKEYAHEMVLQEEKQQREVNGVIVAGYPDRLEKLDNGKYVVVDFKTGKHNQHKVQFATTDKTNHDKAQKLVKKGRQILLYAYLLSEKYEIDHCEYRYPDPLVDSVECYEYNENIVEVLEKDMEFFKSSMQDGKFPVTTDSDTCKYCKYSTICGKN